jgi:hypothetical protein
MKDNKHPPSFDATAFDCPHCGAFTTQKWYKASCKPIDHDHRTPKTYWVFIKESLLSPDDLEKRRREWHVEHFRAAEAGDLRILKIGRTEYYRHVIDNLYFSECYNCNEAAIWLHDKLIYPPLNFDIEPNKDLPVEMRRDYDEARAIIAISPRGAAALLRLVIQKLCIYLGAEGKNLNKDIAYLVKNGLSTKVQKSLDLVRVIGNSAVHPGTLDGTDDPSTAATLFRIVNVIVEQMISTPEDIDEMFDGIPEEKRAAIIKRDSGDL